MHFFDHRAAQTGPPAGTIATTKLPVPVASLRWALVRRLVFAIPLGLLFGVMLINGFRVNESAVMAVMAGGVGLSFSLFLGIIWLVGRRRRALFAASGGDPDAARVLLFGAMAQKIGRLGPYSESGFHRWAAGFGAGGDGGRGDWG